MKQECFPAWIDEHPCPHVLTDGQRRVRWMNPAAESVLACSVDEIAGRPLEAIFPSIGEGPGASGEAAASGVLSCQLRDRDGKNFDVDVTPLPESFGDTVWVLHRSVAAEPDASGVDLSRDDLLSHVSHEVRTPMNSILGFTALLTEVESPRRSETGTSASSGGTVPTSSTS